MTRRDMPPTRSNLMEARKTFNMAQEGHAILEKKHEALSAELRTIAHEATRLQASVWDLLSQAYRALDDARLVLGREHLEWAALSVNQTIDIEITPRSVMGVAVPAVQGRGGPPEISYGMGNTTVSLDEAVQRFREVLENIPELAQTLTTVWRLARELQKAQRRVNALEHVFIPDYEETIAYIEDVLEEREREDIYRMKRVKAMHAKPEESTEADTAA